MTPDSYRRERVNALIVLVLSLLIIGGFGYAQHLYREAHPLKIEEAKPPEDDNVTIGDHLYTCHAGYVKTDEINMDKPVRWPHESGSHMIGCGNTYRHTCYMVSCTSESLEMK
jgi:hypothetical protein